MNLRTPISFGLASLVLSVLLRGEDTWKPLLNGKDLSGWETFLDVPLPKSDLPGAEKDANGRYIKPLGVNNDPLHVFKIEEVDGKSALHVSGEGMGTLTTLATYSNFDLKFQFKWGQKKWASPERARNAGLLYHGYGAEGAVTGRWMHTQQFQIQEGACGEYVSVGETGMQVRAKSSDGKRFVYDPAGELLLFSAKSPQGVRCLRSGDFEKPLGEWNTFELICVGDSAVHIVNGHVVLRASGSQRLTSGGSEPLTEGHLQIQLEGSEMFFRDMELREVKAIPAEWAEK